MSEFENDPARAEHMAYAMNEKMTEAANLSKEAKRLEELADSRDDSSGGKADTDADHEEARLLQSKAKGQEIVANAIGDAAGAKYDREAEETLHQDETIDPEDYEHLDPNA